MPGMATLPVGMDPALAAPPWIVQPHGNLEPVDEGVWTVDGTIHLPIGAFPRRMSVVRLAGGRLLIWSAIALDDATLQELESLGTPAFLVVPNDHHREDALAWKLRFPALRVAAPPGSADKVQSEVGVDTRTPHLDDPTVRCDVVPGTREHEFALLVRRAGGSTLIVNDIIANMRHVTGFSGWLLKRMGFAGEEPHVPAPIRALLVREKAALREQMLAWAALSDLKRIVVSHGDIITHDPRGVLRALAEALS
jgi:hypothetical protein